MSDFQKDNSFEQRPKDSIGALNSLEVLTDQAVHIQAFKKIGDQQYQQVLDCSGEIYTADGRVGTAGHCVKSTEQIDAFKITDGKGNVHFATDVDIDAKHDLAIISMLNVQPSEYKNLSKPSDEQSTNSGDPVSANVFSNGSDKMTAVAGVLAKDTEMGFYVPEGRNIEGQDMTMLAKKVYGEFSVGNSGALLFDSKSKSLLGIMDYSSKSSATAVAIPFKYFEELLNKKK